MTAWSSGAGALGRILYRDGQAVGMVDSPEIAREIVEALNAWQNGTLPGELPAGAVWVEPGRTFAINASSEPTRLPESGRERSPGPEPVDGCECDECAPPCTQPGCCGNPPEAP